MLVSIYSKDHKYKASVNLDGGMLEQAYKEDFPIFYNSPWRFDGSDLSNLDKLTKHLGGSFTCLPFGITKESIKNYNLNYPHGLSCNEEWQLVSKADDMVVLKITYPNDYDIEYIIKTVSLDSQGIHINIKIMPRENVKLTYGEHPCFKIDDSVEINISGEVVAYPKKVEKCSRFKQSEWNSSLSKVKLDDDTYIDAAFLPLDFKTEEVLQAIRPNGKVELLYKKTRKAISMRWSAEKLQSCLIWISNGGRDYFPWNSRNFCIGLEPIASAWDLPCESLEQNCFNEKGINTYITFKKGQIEEFDFHFDVTNY